MSGLCAEAAPTCLLREQPARGISHLEFSVSPAFLSEFSVATLLSRIFHLSRRSPLSETLGQFSDKRFRYFIIIMPTTIYFKLTIFPIVLFSRSTLSLTLSNHSFSDRLCYGVSSERAQTSPNGSSPERKDFPRVASLGFTSNSSVFFDLSLK